MYNGLQSGNTALRAATALGDVDCICALLDYGANVNQETSRGTALLAASAQGDIDIISLLLDKGADIDHETASGTQASCSGSSNNQISCQAVRHLARPKAS